MMPDQNKETVICMTVQTEMNSNESDARSVEYELISGVVVTFAQP